MKTTFGHKWRWNREPSTVPKLTYRPQREGLPRCRGWNCHPNMCCMVFLTRSQITSLIRAYARFRTVNLSFGWMSTSGHQAPEGLAALHPTEGDGWCTYFHPWNQIVTWKNVGFPFIWQEQGFVSCWALWMDDLLTPATAAGGESSHQHTRWMFHPTGGSWMNVLESSLPCQDYICPVILMDEFNPSSMWRTQGQPSEQCPGRTGIY